MYVDGLRIGDIEQAILRDRENLSKGGIVFAVIAIDEFTRKIVYGPDIVSRGIILSEELIEEAKLRLEKRSGDNAGRRNHRLAASEEKNKRQRFRFHLRKNEKETDGHTRCL